MSASESPDTLSIDQLTRPLQAPGALPEGISLAVGVIAHTPPRQLREVLLADLADHFDAHTVAELWPAVTRDAEGLYRDTQRLFTEEHRRRLADAERRTGEFQDILGMEGSLGMVPSGRDVDRLMERHGQVEEIRAEKPEENTHVIGTRDHYVEAAAEQMSAELDLPRLQAAAGLREEIRQNVQRLGRRDRLATIAAGLLLGVSTGLGLVAAVAPESNSDAALKQTRVAGTAVVVGAGGTLGTLVGAGVASGMGGRFARRRAQAMVRAAEKRAS